MIPVLIVPVLNRPDLLRRMLDSVDVIVGREVIIDNSPDGTGTPDLEDGDGRVVLRLRHNLGVASSWNLGIRVTPLAPWWLIVNNDVVFAPGDLSRIADAIARHDVVWMPDMRTFAITHWAIERVGWFSEEFVPAYFEDNDWAYRCGLMGVHIEALGASAPDRGSQTIRSDRSLALENDRTFPQNRERYRLKWGGMPDHETFTTPFGDPHADPRAWSLTMGRLRDLTWRTG